jgi:DNA repair photolyase
MSSPNPYRRDLPRKGRGAVANISGRFEVEKRYAVNDGWDFDNEAHPLRTTVTPETCRHVISYNKSPDVAFDRSINPYRGCEHGCIYCYARPSHAYMGLSPGLDFETRLFVKKDAAAVLEREFRRPGYLARPLMVGSNTDPYQPVERSLEVTRSILKVCARFNHPVAVTTKSALILRDLDILAPMAERNLVAIGVSITSLEPSLLQVMEPRAPSFRKRLDAVRGLSGAGIPVTVLAAPMIPALNDFELESILAAGVAAGAGCVGYILLRLPLELKELFCQWLETHFPDRAQRVLNTLSETRNGALYRSAFGVRKTGTGVHADLLAKRVQLICKRLGVVQAQGVDLDLNTTLFQPPPKPGDQLSLL